MQPITRQDIFSLLERYCDPSLEVLGLGACQVACGINTPFSLQARGLDEPAWLQRSMCGPLYWVPTTEMPPVDGDIHKQAKVCDFRQAFIEATTLSEASQVVTQAQLSKVSQSISQVTTGDSEVDANRPIVAS